MLFLEGFISVIGVLEQMNSIKKIFTLLAATTALTVTDASAQQNGNFGQVVKDINTIFGKTQGQPHSTNKGIITGPDAAFEKPHVANSLPQDTLYTDLRPWRNNPEYRIFAEQRQQQKETNYRLYINNANTAFNNLKARAGWVFAGLFLQERMCLTVLIQ